MDDKKEDGFSTYSVWHSGGTYEDLNCLSLSCNVSEILFCERLDSLLSTSSAQLASSDKPA